MVCWDTIWGYFGSTCEMLGLLENSGKESLDRCNWFIHVCILALKSSAFVLEFTTGSELGFGTLIFHNMFRLLPWFLYFHRTSPVTREGLGLGFTS